MPILTPTEELKARAGVLIAACQEKNIAEIGEQAGAIIKILEEHYEHIPPQAVVPARVIVEHLVREKKLLTPATMGAISTAAYKITEALPSTSSRASQQLP